MAAEDKNSRMALIILLDQFPRHFVRSTPDFDLRRAGEYSLQAVERLRNSSCFSELNASECCFAMMPLRHLSTLEASRDVFNAILERGERMKEDEETLKRFKAATLRR